MHKLYPLIPSSINLGSGSTLTLPNKSSIEIDFNASIFALPSLISSKDGVCMHDIPNPSIQLRISFFRPILADGIAKAHPLKRLGEGKDSASLAKFLITDESAWVTGQIIAVDGGRSKLS